MKTTTTTLSQKAKRPRPSAGGVKIRTILVATDFSPTSLKALEYAQTLAREFRAAIHLVNVLDVQLETPTLAPLFLSDAEVERRLRERLHDIATVYAEPIRKGRCHATQGRACDEVCRVARRIKADLIIVATRGYTGFKHAVMGSTAERIVRHADCPVLVVREKERDFVCGKGNSKIAGTREVSIRRILVPTDFSNYSRAALQYAVRLAKRFDAQLTLMNVIHPNYFVTNGDYIALDYPSLLVEVRRAAKHDLASLVKETAFQGVPFRALIDEGHPGDRIVDYAEKCGADLIVSATHGRTGLRHALIGSTAEYVVRHAKCPVLVVPRSASTKATSGKTK